MKNQKNKTKISATTVTLILIFAMTFSLIALPAVTAQLTLIMNPPGNEGEPHYLLIVDGPENYDIDLNEGPGPMQPVDLWIKYPSRADFTLIGTYTTTDSGDLDVYDFDFNETGSWELKWMVGEISSNIETVIAVDNFNDFPPQYIESFIYGAASPALVGVGQQLLILAWTADIPPDIGEEQGLIPSPNSRAGWDYMSVTLNKPDGTSETIDFPRSDPVGANWITYTPSQVGIYTFQTHFIGEWKNSTAGVLRYEPDDSDIGEFVVQEDPITAWPETPITEDYWMRPINSAQRLWYPLAGNWLRGAANVWPTGASGGTTNSFAYGMGTGTAHILWTKQYYTGGLMDERYGSMGYATAHYQGLGFSGVVVQGKLYYSPRVTHAGTSGLAIVDLYTGEELFFDYEQNMPSMGQVYDYESPNQHGGFAYTWRTSGVTLPDQVNLAYARQLPDLSLERIRSARTVNSEDLSRTGTLWEMIDAFTDQTICYVANVSTSGRSVYTKDGSICYYNVRNLGGTNYLQVWNSTAGTMVISPYGTGYWQWRPAGGGFGGADAFFGSTSYNNVHDGNVFYTLNASIPSLQGPRNSRQNQTASIQAVREGEYVIFGTSGINDDDGIAPAWFMAVSLEEGNEGDKLWETTFNPPYKSVWGSGFGNGLRFSSIYPEDDVALYLDDIDLKYYAYDIRTGEKLWESEPQIAFSFYGASTNVYDGILYSYGYGGVIYAYDIRTGEILWRYDAITEGFESAYGGRYTIGVGIISADGKLYTVTGEHSPTQPLYRGRNLRCLNATTGEEIWKILGFFGGMSPTSANILMADGILVGLNLFDNQLYAFGRGPSGTTVTASPKYSTLGTKVVVEGTVTDQTPGGRRNTNDIFEFSLKGTPAISDEDQAAWMEHMFMGQPYPEYAKGVELVLTVLDPNNNTYEVGKTTSTVTGAFGLAFEPPVPGTYQITANFEGSEAYGPSSATTFVYVDEAPSPGAPIEPEPTTPEPATPEPTTPEPATPEPTTPEPTDPTEAPFITTEIAIVAVVAVACVIGIVSFWALKKRK